MEQQQDPKIIKRFKHSDEPPEEITIDEAIEYLEVAGYWKEGTAHEMLLNGEELFTPYSTFKIKATQP